tara:strand:- start:131 stop:841 length:711 start_codon:yes stop_codon:yes gene_type:complete
MKKIILILLILTMSIPITYGQDTGITGVTTGDLFSGGNVMLRKLMKRDYSEADGSPYLNDKFVKGKITFDNGKEYDILTRLNVGSQKFEIRKDLNSEISIIEINESVTIKMENKKYNLHSINLENKQILAVLEKCVENERMSLYYFPRKVIKMPVETGAVAPTTGFTKTPKPKWADANEFLILNNNNWYTVPNSFKKLVEKNIFDQKLLKKYKKSNKLNVKKKESLIKLVSYFNSI